MTFAINIKGLEKTNKIRTDIELDKWDAVIALVVGCVVAIVYSRTTVPGLLPGDSGEFQTLAYLLGNTHPTGYPVYLVLTRLFAFLPLGELAFRINLFSALMGALAVMGVYLCGRLLSGYRAISAVGAIALAVSPTFWSQAVIAEVYTSGTAFFAFILLALLLWDKRNSTWALFAAGLLGGLSLGVHMSVLLLAPAALLFLLLHWQRGRPIWKTAILGSLIGLALTILLFVLIDRNNPSANYFNTVVEPSRTTWGYEAAQIDEPMERLLFHWQGRQFQYRMFANIDSMPGKAKHFFVNLSSELAIPLILLAVTGAIWLLINRPPVAVLLIGALVIQLLFSFNYSIWDIYVYHIPSYLLLALLATGGLHALIETGSWVASELFSGLKVNKKLLDTTLALLVLAFAIWPIFHPRLEGFVAGKISFSFSAYPQYNPSLKPAVEATVANLPQNAFVFTDWDMMWPYYYTAYLESDRSDVTFFSYVPDPDAQEELPDSLVELVNAKLGERPILFESRIVKLEQLEQMQNIHMDLKQVGPVLFFSITGA